MGPSKASNPWLGFFFWLKISGRSDSLEDMNPDFPKLEEEVLEVWKKEKTFEKSLARRKKAPKFVFFEGPPTANGMPGIHHVLGRSFKDIILRYKTMRGFLVNRKGGWDTHGLPVELQVEKELGLKSKKDIEQYGIAAFNKKCKESVWKYKGDWEKLTERMGFWIDLKNPYITYENSYIETLWQIIKTFWQKKLLYKDYKVVAYCPRCGTPLSSHEMAQGYKTVKERSVYVKFKVEKSKIKAPENTYFLAWTTTPWTLPGNVALAVHPKIIYSLAQVGSEHFILAKDLAVKILGEHKVIKTFLGSELVGSSYVPLFKFGTGEKGKKIWEVVPANFVSVKEGTGIVHTAVAYGQDDFELGKKENLAMLHLVDERGKFKAEVIPWKGMFVKDADPLIIEDLKQKGLLLKEELYEHEYPFCWRCSTPLLYYAKEGWFVNMQKVKKEILKNNDSINWIPAHMKKGRMGEWLKELKDWAFSRERYWGTPLPVWQCKKCSNTEVVGSLKELLSQSFSQNTYTLLRHGHSERQVLDVMSSWPEKKALPLTEKGVKQIEEAAKELKKKKIDLIFSSDLLRTKQTAEIVGKALGVTPIFEERLREWNVGVLNGKPLTDLGEVWGKLNETSEEHYMRRFVEPLPEGESYSQVQKRVYEFLQDVEKKYKGKNVLIVSHELPLTLLETTVRGFTRKDINHFRQEEKKYLEPAEWRQIPFATLPLNETMELDFHRPYIDAVKFYCKKCKTGNMERVKDVVDVWFDSGAMPFAQNHWMGGVKPKEFPADYIVEGIDQTRGWFYTLLAVSTLLGFKAPFKNVISFNHVLDAKGEKMSKSKGNVVNPWDMIQKYGIDAVRWYFYTANNPGDPKLFAEKDIQQTMRSFFLIFWNCFVFYNTYKAKTKSKTKHVLDTWIRSRLNYLTQEVTEKLDSYDVTAAARAIQDFVVNDLSLWYIRRSRTRAKEAAVTLRFVLCEVSKLSAPFIPFLAEHIFKSLGEKGSPSTSLRASVHLADWSKVLKSSRSVKIEQEMAEARVLVAKALAERAKAGIKVRQPLQELKIKTPALPAGRQKQKLREEILNLVKDEVNVKEIVFDAKLKQEVELDTKITPELKEEGMLREITRAVQGMRKDAGFVPSQKIALRYEGDQELVSLLLKHKIALQETLGIKAMEQGIPESQNKKQLAFEEKSLWLSITELKQSS